MILDCLPGRRPTLCGAYKLAGMPYWERLSETAFRATHLTSGAWNIQEQHIAPAMGLLAHLVER